MVPGKHCPQQKNKDHLHLLKAIIVGQLGRIEDGPDVFLELLGGVEPSGRHQVIQFPPNGIELLFAKDTLLAALFHKSHGREKDWN